MLLCIYCNKECKNLKSYRNHERLCKLNPNRQTTPFQDLSFQKHKNGKVRNQYLKARALGLPVPVISDITKQKISVASSNRKHSEESKKKIAEKARLREAGGVPRSRWIKYKGFMLGSTYELIVAQSLDENNVQWTTCKRFKYIDPNGNIRTYTPDFYLPEYDVYLDPKNDFLIEKINPKLGFNDLEKIRRAEIFNNIRVLVLDKNNLGWEQIKTIIGSRFYVTP